MKRLLINALLLFAIIFLGDFVIGSTLQKMFFANRSGAPGYVLNHVANKKYDAYVMGSSGAQRGYIPAVFQKELGLTVFNTGETGTNIFHNYAALRLILKHNKPKLIIWDFTDADYYYRPDAGKTAMITPYYRDSEIRKLLTDITPLNRIWLLSRIYPYNQKMLSIIGTYIRKPKPGVEGDNGYHALTGVLNPDTVENPSGIFTDEMKSIASRTPDQQAKDRIVRRYFFAFIRLCRENNIRLMAFYCPKAPLTEALASTPSLSDELRDELEKHNIPLFCIMPKTYPEMNNLSYYYDVHHLNHAGALAFSNIVAGLLKPTSPLPSD
jgi:hypothetical protein